MEGVREREEELEDAEEYARGDEDDDYDDEALSGVGRKRERERGKEKQGGETRGERGRESKRGEEGVCSCVRAAPIDRAETHCVGPVWVKDHSTRSI